MPDNSGVFTEEDSKKVDAWFKQHWRAGKCPISGHNDWTVVNRIVYVPIFTQPVTLGGGTYPQIMVMCKDCGYTIYFNAVVMGIVSGAEYGK